MEYVLIPLLIPMLLPIAVLLIVSYSTRSRYLPNFFQSRKVRYIAIVILLAISLPTLITGLTKDDPQWTSTGMIISYILLGFAIGLLLRPLVRLITSPVRLVKQARKKFLANISTYGSVGTGTYFGKGADDEVNGVPIKWKMLFTFTDESGTTRKESSIIYYKKDELEYYKNNNFAVKILGKHAVITELPFEKTKAKIAQDNTTCRYCGTRMDPKALSCLNCGARR